MGKLKAVRQPLNNYRIECLLSDRPVYLASPDIIAAYVKDLRNLLSDSPLAERKVFTPR